MGIFETAVLLGQRAANLHARAFVMELHPGYCDLARARYEQLRAGLARGAHRTPGDR